MAKEECPVCESDVDELTEVCEQCDQDVCGDCIVEEDGKIICRSCSGH